jgi:eukaryotic-like serine/threonine-protein kinase
MTGNTVHESLPSVETSSAEEARQLYADLLSGLPDDSAFDTSGLLNAHPGLRSHKSVVVDLAFEEYTRRLELGEDLTPTEFASRFPTIQKSLVQLLEVNRFLFDNSLVPPSLAETVWPEAGDLFLNFQLVTEIGRGSFSRVFLAKETDLGDRRVVVKVCVGGAHEAQILGRLEHDAIVPVFSADLDIATGLTGICMPYAGRTTLVDILDMTHSRGFPDRATQIAEVISASSADDDETSEILCPRFRGTYVDGVVTIARDLTEALVYSHGEGIVHSDIKPSNVLLTPAGQAMLIDFNLSHGEDAEIRFGGTFPYMAPEQLRGLTSEATSDERDIRTDIFALGATLYELLTGTLPLDLTSGAKIKDEERAETARRLLVQQQRGVTPLQKLNPQVDAQLAAAIERCLAFRPEDRWQTPEELLEELKKHQTQLSRIRRSFHVRRKTVLTTAGVFLLAFGAIGGYVMARESEVERQIRLGHEALQQNRPAEAIACFNSALDGRSDDEFDGVGLDALMERGQAFLQVGDVERAFQDFLIVEEQRGDALSVAAVGYCFVVARKCYYDGAERFLRAARLGWDNPVALANNVGYCRLKSAKLDEAERRLSEALRIDPFRQVVLYNLGMLNYARSLRHKSHDRAYIVRATELDEPSAELWLDVAATFAVSARRALPTDRQASKAQIEKCQAFTRRSIDAAEKSIELGLIPRRLEKVALYLPAKSKELNELISRPAPSTQPAPVIRVISPFEKVSQL